MRFGGEKRIFLNNFFQPDNTSGSFTFSPNITMQSVFSPDSLQGNGLASMLVGWGSGALVARPHVANKSGELLSTFKMTGDYKRPHAESGTALRVEHSLFGTLQSQPAYVLYMS
jgi:hypothetical protein